MRRWIILIALLLSGCAIASAPLVVGLWADQVWDSEHPRYVEGFHREDFECPVPGDHSCKTERATPTPDVITPTMEAPMEGWGAS